MIMQRSFHTHWAVWLTVLLAFMLDIMPLHHTISIGRPVWIVLIMVYWILIAPDHFNLGFAFIIGILLDVITATHFGVHSIILVSIAFFVSSQSHRLRLFPWAQQMFVLMLITIAYQLSIIWCQIYLFHNDTPLLLGLVPALSNALIWPYVVKWLRCLHHTRNIN